MADQNNPHFKELFWFCVGIVVIGFGYIFYVTIEAIPEKNQRTVDTVVGFALGSMVMSAVGYLLGGNPTQSKQKDTTILPTSTIDTVNIDNTNNADKPKEDETK